MRISKERPVALQRDLKLEEPPNRWQLFVTWLLESLTPGVPVVSTFGANSALKSPASIWRGVVFVALVVGMMAMGRSAWAFSCLDVTEIFKAQCETLVALYDSTDGDNWKNNTGWKQTNTPCSWFGVSCENSTITFINLGDSGKGGNNLVGSLPDLSALTGLQSLFLDKNQLTGNIPDVSALVNMRQLSLAGNDLIGSIPDLSSLTSLQMLSLSYNQLIGPLPDLNKLTNLGRLYLGSNQLSGVIPNLSKLTKLWRLYLGGNQFTGTIPKLPASLQELSLANNKLTGAISDLSAFTKLTSIGLTGNQLCQNTSADYGNWTEVNEYPVCGNPNITLTSPVHGATSIPISGQVFTWEPDPVTSAHRIVISTQADFAGFTDTVSSGYCNDTTTCLTAANTGIQSYTALGLSENTTYYWKVRASKNPTFWSEVHSFTTGAAPKTGCNGDTQLPDNLCNGLTLYMPMNGNANDASGNGSDGVVNGATLTTDRHGNADSAYEFDGQSNYISIADSPQVDFARTQDFAIMVWLQVAAEQPSNTIGDNDIIEKWNDGKTSYPYVIRYHNATSQWPGTIGVNRYDGTNSASLLTKTLFNDEQFHHLAYVKTGDTLQLYVDGKLEAQRKDTITGETTNNSPLFLGRRGTDAMPNFFKGNIDELFIYNRALTESEIQQLYNGTKNQGDINPTDGKYTVYGTIRDELGNKLAGVEVQVAGQTVTTDNAGNWEVSNLQQGEYTVTVSKDGYTFAPENVALGNDEFRQETVLKPLSNLKVKVVAEPRTVVQNDNVTYIATVINGGDKTATGIVLTNVLPENAGLVSIEALDGGECDADTITCTLPDLTTGNSARVKLVVSNTQAKSLLNTATVTTNEYPADVQKTRTRVIPYLAASITDSPEPLQLPLPGEERVLHYDVAATLSANAPTKATGVNLVMTLPKGVELQAINSDFGMCDTSELPVLTCSMTDLSVASADDISHVTVGIDVVLKDAGLLALTLEAKLSANEYPVHTDKERTSIFIDPEYKVGLAFVIDDSGSMQGEINQVKAALNNVIDTISSEKAPLSVLLTFGDQVKYRAVTQDLTVLRDAIGKLKATGGGTCPEASYEAISFAIPHVKEGGTILFATDASPYEGSDVDDMMARLRSNGIIFNAMVFGDCTDENSWNK